MKKRFDFAQEFGELDENLIARAGEPWNGKSSVLHFYSRRLAGAAAILILAILLAGNSGVQAAVKEFTTKIGELFGFEKDLSSYTEVLNQTKTQNGISITLHEVILDEHALMVSLVAHFGDVKQSPPLRISEEKTTINGKSYWVYSSMNGGSQNLELMEEYDMNPEIILMQCYEDMILPEGEAKIHLVLEAGDRYASPVKCYENAEEFVYDFVITPDELREQTVRINPDLSFSLGDGRKLEIHSLTMNDLYCQMTAAGLSREDELVNDYALKLRGEDSLGNPVCMDFAGFLLEDDEMRFETSLFGDYEAGTVIEEDEVTLSIPDKDCEYMDLQLYARKIIYEPLDAEDAALLEGGEYYVKESMDSYEQYSRMENYGWEPLGEKFRIYIQEEAAAGAVIGGADAPTEILLK